MLASIDITQWHPVLQALVRVLLLVLPLLMIVPGLIWWERRLLSWMQDRIGPNRVGPFGLLQPIADGVKLFFKEDITPAAVDRLIYFIAPAVALFPAFALGAVLPWGPTYGTYGHLTPIADVSIGVLYMLAISSLGVYGVVLAGYSGNNKYSLLGGLRASAQLISYELAMGMSLAVIVLATGSLKVTEMVKAQEQPLWGVGTYFQNWFAFTPFGFVAMIVFLICMVAETNRAPFDLPEAENELIAGYHTEYSSMKFAVFFMGEYAAMLVFGGLLSAVFLGGYNILPIRFDALIEHFPSAAWFWNILAKVNYWGAPLWFLGKCMFMISVFVWLRATLPRLRYDQLMSLGWRSLLPIAVTNFVLVAFGMVIARVTDSAFVGLVSGLAAAGVLLALWKGVQKVINQPDPLASRTIEMEQGTRTIDLVGGAS